VQRLLIDTNVYTHALKGDQQVASMLRSANKIGISSISLGELLSGFKGGAREAQNRKELSEFLDSPRVEIFAIDEETAEYYAQILTNLRKQGTPIPTNDIWIAAVAFQHGLRLFSRDAHFQFVAGLTMAS
jgi:tRNA(fMet)-specific endonuclease VapC